MAPQGRQVSSWLSLFAEMNYGLLFITAAAMLIPWIIVLASVDYGARVHGFI
jgi:hypothetical protein